MALQGKGDPRWIVSERSDGQNVGQWHWEEWDALSYAKDKIEAAFKDLVLCKFLDDDVTVNRVNSVTGDCTMGIRKKKQWCVYDMEITLAWSTSGTVKYAGTIRVPDFSNISEGKYTVKVETDDSPPELITLIRSVGVPAVHAVLKNITSQLNEKAASKLHDDSAPTTPVSSRTAAKVTGTGNLNLTLHFDTSSPSDVFYTLTDVGRMSMITQSQAVVSRTVGDRFALLDGNCFHDDNND